MARELSQEAVLDFLCQAGGQVTNAALLGHFKSFLRDPAAPPDLRERRRELFKGFVNSVAAVHHDSDGTKRVVLRRRYRDLVGEGTGPGAPPGPQRRGTRRDPATALDQPGTPGPETPNLQRQYPASPVQDRSEPITQETPNPETQRLQRQRPAPSAQNRQEPVTSGTPNPETQHLQRQHPAPFDRDRPEPLTPGAPSPEIRHLQRQHLAPPDRDRQELVTSGSLSPKTPHLLHQHPAPPVQDRSEPGTSHPETLHPANPHLQRHHPMPSAQDRPEPVTPRTLSSETPHLQWVSPTPLAQDRLEPETLSPLHPETAHLQLQRTREWVSRHQQMPEPANQRPVRAWSVLPDDFLQLSSEPAVSIWKTVQAEPTLCSRGLIPGDPTESSESWLGKPPPTVFRSIRCQLSLQDLEEFVDQESHGSEESSSEPRESPWGSEERLQAAPRAPDLEEHRNPAQGLSVLTKESNVTLRSQKLGGGNHSSMQAPRGAEEPLPKTRRSFRRSPQPGRATVSSSDEESLDEDMLKRTRRPPRPRRPSKAGPVPSPRVVVALTTKLAGTKAIVAEPSRPRNWWVLDGEGPEALVPHRPFEHKSSLVPLESREHEWIVKLASGSWIQVLALFWKDPQLALRRDFLTGYTALHWIAKHGSLCALQDLVSGARKTGIVLDVNVKSSCGYTPLHLAAIHGHQGVIKLLVQRLASQVNVRDSSGKKPWQYLASNTSREIRQLLGAPQPIFPVHPLVQKSPTRKSKSREISRHITRKTSLAALLKSQHNKWKLSNHHEKFPTSREREEYSD
ncbi:ankyrin repeat domain-containing protein SOWAHB [Cavia porcellus]|uniref:ankyrin repeat domain-containing protein SOWAHB n=1 Tax=Cavia porcellus TaxID=10141 RepID=UPI002FE1AF19